jgi:hypothetical protein
MLQATLWPWGRPSVLTEIYANIQLSIYCQSQWLLGVRACHVLDHVNLETVVALLLWKSINVFVFLLIIVRYL